MRPHPEELAPGTTLADGRFVINRVLGHGSQGTTYEATDKQRGEAVALKQFSLRHASSWKDVELAEREAQVLARLAHPSLPRYVAHFEQDGALYLAMEKVEGETLRTLRETGHFSQQDAIRLLQQGAATLDYLHVQAPPVIHRDIKPSNVIRRPDGSFALVDFGSVRHRLDPADGSTVVGTFGYMAPEQFQGRAMPATDTYALAATTLSMLTGHDPDRLPHKGLTIDVRAALGGAVDPRLEAVLTSALDPDPEQRGKLSLAQLLQRHRLGPGAQQHFAEPERPRPGRAAANTQPRAGEPFDRRAHRAARDARRRERHERRAQRHRTHFPVAVRRVLALALALLRVGVGVLFLLVLPVLLMLLSVALGPKLRNRARQARVAGRQLQHALAGIGARLARSENDGVEAEPWQSASAHDQPRVRVETPGPARQRVVEPSLDFGDVDQQLRDFEGRLDEAVDRISQSVRDSSRKR